MPHQEALTVCAVVRPTELADLRDRVAKVAADPAGNALLPFRELPAVHFARLMLVDGAPAGAPGHWYLVLTIDCDAPGRRTLQQLAERAGPGLDELYGRCDGYPVEPTPSTRLSYLRAHLETSDVFYLHSVGRSLPQIRGEARLRGVVEEFLDAQAERLAGCPPSEVHAAVREFIAGDAGLAWALRPPDRPALGFRLREGTHKVLVPLVLVLLLPVLVPALAAWFLWLRYHELTDRIPRTELDAARMRALGDAEDFYVMNAFTSLAPIKPGLFWRLSARLSLFVGNYSARHIFTRGSLSGLTTVHFARFMRLGPARALLFTSYYDGSLESYNNDFVDQVAWVLNTVFGQQEGYPRTRWLFGAGARDEQGFKRFIRGHQIPNEAWYSAYPHLAAVTLDQNARLRAGLVRERLSDEEAQAWLDLR